MTRYVEREPDDIDFVEQLKADEAKDAARKSSLARPQRSRTPTKSSDAQDNIRRWLDATFKGVIDDIASTTEGGRNTRLRWGARRLAEIAHAGLTESECKRALEDAAKRNGIWKEDGPAQCRASIRSGWDKGVSEPFDVATEITSTSTTTSKAPNARQDTTTRQTVVNGEFAERSITLKRLSTVKTRVPTWVWEHDGVGRIQHGTLTMFAGKPAAGKSTAVRWFAARMSRGELPGIWHGTPMNVAIVMAEEQMDAVVVPGLQAANADLNHVFTPEIHLGETESGMASIADEAALTELLIEMEVAALFVDPIMSTFGGSADIYRNNEVRQHLAPWTRIARAINGVVIGVTHLRKGDVRDVLAGMNGSSAFGEVPRAVFGFAPTDAGEHVMEQVKNSAGPVGLKLAYTLPVTHLEADDGQMFELPRFEIIGETEISIADIDPSSDETTDVSVACEWLREYLRMEQPASSAQVKRDAKTHGDIKDWTLKRAMKRIGVVVHSRSEPGKPFTTVWSLPGYQEW